MDSSPFFGMIGQVRLCQALERMLLSGTLPHALLLVGPESIGKTTMTLMLMRAILGGPPKSHPDAFHVRRIEDPKTGKPKRRISVSQIRELNERMAQSPLGSAHAAFIEEADLMSPGAANALLKTLEEPRSRAHLILRAPSADAVLPTVRSRCQMLRLAPVPRAEIDAAMRAAGVGGEEASRAAAVSLGRPGRALRYIKDTGFRAQEDVAAGCLDTFSEGLPSRLRHAAEAKDSGIEAFDRLEAALRGGMLAALGAGQPAGRLARSLGTLREARAAFERGGNPQIALEHALLHFSI